MAEKQFDPDITKALTDASSPYFLHSSDQPNHSLVDTPLNGDNYTSWHRAISRALNAKNKLGFVISSPPKPKDNAVVALWSRCCDMIMSWLLHSIDKQLASSLVYCATPADLWIELETRFQQSNQTQIFRIKRDIANLTQDNLSVTQYYGRLKTLLEELVSLQSVNPCTCEAAAKYFEIQSADQVYQFLMGLNETYHQLRSQILAVDPLPSLARCYSIIHQEENQRLLSVSTTKTDAMAFLSRPPNRTSTPQSRQKKVWPPGSPICFGCQNPSHTRDRRFEEIGYPEWWPGKQKPSTKSTSAVHNVTASSTVLSTSVIPGLSSEQYSHLLELL